jgi:hypothetical protein
MTPPPAPRRFPDINAEVRDYILHCIDVRLDPLIQAAGRGTVDIRIRLRIIDGRIKPTFGLMVDEDVTYEREEP